jgi:hypothetical protein
LRRARGFSQSLFAFSVFNELLLELVAPSAHGARRSQLLLWCLVLATVQTLKQTLTELSRNVLSFPCRNSTRLLSLQRSFFPRYIYIYIYITFSSSLCIFFMWTCQANCSGTLFYLDNLFIVPFCLWDSVSCQAFFSSSFPPVFHDPLMCS